MEDSLPTTEIGRIGDMHQRKALHVFVAEDGDIVVSISTSSMPLGDLFGDHNASVEFCTLGGGGGRSRHTREALQNLIEAMEKDNLERPDADPAQANE